MGKFKVQHGYGQKSNPTYTSWCQMKTRCFNKNRKDYKYYGGRGITVCERWLDFKNFLEDMGDRPAGMYLDRIDNNKGYSKENCRWVSHKEQCRNRRSNITLTYKGRTLCLAEWAIEIRIKDTTIRSRYNRKWPVEKILNYRKGDNEYI